MSDAHELPIIELPPYRGAPSIHPEMQEKIIYGEKMALSQFFLKLAEQTPQWAVNHGIRMEVYKKALELACTHITQAMQRRALRERRFKILAPTATLSMYYLQPHNQVVVSHCPRCGHARGIIPLFGNCSSCNHDIPLPDGLSEKSVRKIALNLRYVFEAELR